MPEIQIPPYTRGIDNRSNERALPEGAVVDAVNVDFDREGAVQRRPGAVQVSATPIHSLWKSSRTGNVYGVSSGDLVRVSVLGDAATYTVIRPLDSDAPAEFCDLTDRVVISNGGWIGEIFDDDTTAPLGVERPGISAPVALEGGGLLAGRYGVAVSFLRAEEEGPLSHTRFVTVEDNGSFRLDNLPLPNDTTITAALVYRTAPDGDVLHQVARIPAGLTSFVVGAGQLGRVAPTRNTVTMPAGHSVRLWRGRLLVARSRTLSISEPMRYGLYDPRHGFIQEADAIQLIAPVDGGVFVATTKETVFYSGSRPSEFVRTPVATAPAVKGSAAYLSTQLLNPALEVGGSSVAAVWLTQAGYVIGLPTGQVIQVQADRLAIHPQRADTVIHGRRILSLFQ